MEQSKRKAKLSVNEAELDKDNPNEERNENNVLSEAISTTEKIMTDIEEMN